MEFEEIIKNRRSIRSYQSRSVSDEKIRKILELSNLSPSAGNLQARRVLLVRDQQIKRQIAKAALGQDLLYEAPIVFVICAVPEESAKKYEQRGRKLYALQDATIFASYLQLAATSMNLSSCWVGAFDEQIVAQILSLPEGVIPIALIPVGYADEKLEERSRKTIDEILL